MLKVGVLTSQRKVSLLMYNAIAVLHQGHGRPLWLMQGMFRANGGCGYVKKPELLLKTDANNEVHDPKRLLSVKTTLKVNRSYYMR